MLRPTKLSYKTKTYNSHSLGMEGGNLEYLILINNYSIKLIAVTIRLDI
jgi:hypothetical protein